MNSSEKLGLVWDGSVFATYSLSFVNRMFCLKLIERGHDVGIWQTRLMDMAGDSVPRHPALTARLQQLPTRPLAGHVRQTFPPIFDPPSAGRWILMQPWEFGSLPRDWIDPMLRDVDEIWVHTHFVKECYERSGIPSKQVHVIPLCADAARFHPDAPPFHLHTTKSFKFLFVGGTIPRKGVAVLLRAYTQTFTADDDVCLVLKDVGTTTFYKNLVSSDDIAHYRGLSGAPEIEYVPRMLSEDDLPGIYTACDCLVHPYHGEGFGLPMLEAMASGLPVIVTGYGAALDFCNHDHAYLIHAREKRLNEMRVAEWETADYPWLAEVDLNHLCDLLRHVYTNRDEARAKGARAAEMVRKKWTWDRAAQAVEQRLYSLQGLPIRRFNR